MATPFFAFEAIPYPAVHQRKKKFKYKYLYKFHFLKRKMRRIIFENRISCASLRSIFILFIGLVMFSNFNFFFFENEGFFFFPSIISIFYCFFNNFIIFFIFLIFFPSLCFVCS